MKLTKKDIRLFRTVNIIFAFISVLIIIFVAEKIGILLLILSLIFLFTPYKVGDDINNMDIKKQPVQQNDEEQKRMPDTPVFIIWIIFLILNWHVALAASIIIWIIFKVKNINKN